MKRFAVLAAGVLGLCAIVFADNALLINGAGATFPYPIYSKWFDVYHTKNPNFQFNYQSVGSGAGIKQVTEGTVDFGATDGPMNDEQLKAFQDKHNGTGILHFPTVLGADVPTYNIPGVSGALNFTPEGNFVKADLASVTAAAAGAAKEMPDDFRVSITNPPGKTAYPISSFTWLLIPQKFQDAGKRDAVKNFLKWMLADGQSSVEALSYAKLPKEVVEKEKKAINNIQ